MKNLNKKGVGLVMAIMIITVLLIMASGFFVVTSYMTKATQSELERVRLYWAAESGSNYSVQWWTAQEDVTRIVWPYFYKPAEETSYTYSGDYDSGLFVEAISGKSSADYNYDALYGGMGGIGNNSDLDFTNQKDSTETGDDWYDWTANTDAAGYTENWDEIIDA
ncbi:MAG: hypothetical protein GQ534_09085, partial [Candidatus Delongbacteria bacterium]|nr:hypothetical protein [Candidatus Delongbacteria bacterium]